MEEAIMTSLVVTKIKHDVKRNKILSERDANILFATMDAQANRMAELEAALRDAEAVLRRLSDNCHPEYYDAAIEAANGARNVLRAEK
jgi:ribosomal protein S6